MQSVIPPSIEIMEMEKSLAKLAPFADVLVSMAKGQLHRSMRLAVPDGWKLVPEAPTAEMEQAAFEAAGSPSDWYGFSEMWHAALAAIPAADVMDESREDLFWKLHSLSKSLESSGRIDQHDQPEAYAAILDAMKLVRQEAVGGPVVLPEPDAVLRVVVDGDTPSVISFNTLTNGEYGVFYGSTVRDLLARASAAQAADEGKAS